MGYMHINNLYKDQDILLFKECYALEKIHGTSANISFDGSNIVKYFSGGINHADFIKIFDKESLLKKFKELFISDVKVFGEAYGGKCQAMSNTYGKEIKFVVFDVKIGNNWLNVPNAEDVAKKLGLEFVSYNKVFTDLNSLDAERDMPSKQAFRNGRGIDKIREGVVLRPLIELSKNNGDRIIAKHKREEFLETATKREVSPEALKVLEESTAIANEWVTAMRLTHILDKIPEENKIVENTGEIIKAMVTDIYREAKGEIVENKDVHKAIGKATAKLFREYLAKRIKE